MTKIKEYLQKLGFEDKQANIFLATYQHGPKPASSIARTCKTERSYTYKVLESMLTENIVQQVLIRGAKNYYIENPDILLSRLNKQEKEIHKLKKEFGTIKEELLQLEEQKIPYMPKIKQFVGSDGIQKRYQDILTEIQEQNLIIIKYLVSDLFESQVTQLLELQEAYNNFINTLEEKDILIQGLLGNGSLVIEQFSPLSSKEDDLSKLSIGNQSMQIWIVGNCSYVGLFRKVPIGIKISSPDLADLWQIMMENIQVK